MANQVILEELSYLLTDSSIMEEVEATIEMGKKLGLQFGGNEEEVRQKLIQMEVEENMDRPNNNGGEAAI